MIITKITSAKQHLNVVLLNNGQEILLDKDICVIHSLIPDMEISEENLGKLIFESQFSRAKSRALWYLDRMDYTEKKLYDKLISKGFHKKAVAAVLANLTEKGIVDDRRYAERFAEKLMDANVSKREALSKMLCRGLPLTLSREVLEEYKVEESDALAKLIETKYAAKLKSENGYQKVYAALVRKGFSYSEVRSALKKYTDDIEFSEEY